jgi:hypothetical protein
MDGEDAVIASPDQLGFGFDEIAEEQHTAHIPSTIDEAIPYYRKLIERHHAAMIAGDVSAAMKIREEAHDLAVKVNGGKLGICGGPDAPGFVLERATAAPSGTVPLWGQTGSFTINVDKMPVRIEQDGMFGVGSSSMFWPGFGAHAVDYDKPFLSETGFRSFIGFHADLVPGITPDVFAREVIQSHIAKDRKGKLGKIERGYVEREMARRAEKTDPKQQEPDL